MHSTNNAITVMYSGLQRYQKERPVMFKVLLRTPGETSFLCAFRQHACELLLCVRYLFKSEAQGEIK